MDIRQLPQTSLPPYFDPNLSTLFISECCLIYMDLDQATEIIHWIVETFKESGVGLIIYEPIGGNDAFGKVMIRNLAVSAIGMTLITDSGNQSQNPFHLRDIKGPGKSSEALWFRWWPGLC
jgi:Leucine carboxyl methyltransferase